MDFKKNKVLIAILVIITFLLFWFMIPSGAVTLKVGQSYSGNSLGLKQINFPDEAIVSHVECWGACSIRDLTLKVGDRISVSCGENAVLNKISDLRNLQRDDLAGQLQQFMETNQYPAFMQEKD